MKNKVDYPRPIVVRANSDNSVSVARVEPMNWWVGMRNNRLLLTLHGHNVALTRPIINAKGVELVSVTATDSVNYLFLNLLIDRDAQPGVFNIELTRDGKTELTIPYELKRRAAPVARGLSGNDTLYLAMPDRFAIDDSYVPSRTMREGVNKRKDYGRHGGNLRGIASHADYLHSLHVSALWLTPVFTSDQDECSYHGYATTDYYEVDPRLGTLADYSSLSSRLAQWGIKLVMDIVLNHCGTRHYWLTDCPSSQWINSWEWKAEPTNYRPGVVADIHASHYDKKRTVEGWFDVTMADLNMRDALLREYMAEVAIWWVETARLAALRVDTYPYADAEGMAWWVGRVREEYPDITIVGETWVASPAILSAWANGGVMLMDFPLQEAVSQAFSEEFAYGRGALRLYDVIANDRVYADPNNMMIFADNHDTGRIFSRLGNDVDALRLSMIFLMTTRGMPQILYGTEIPMAGNSDKGHADIRRDMPVEWMESGSGDIKSLISRLAEIRRDSMAIGRGRLVHFLPTANVYVYFRQFADECVMVVLNMEHKRVTLNVERFAELVGAHLTGVELLTGKKYNGVDKLRVAARSGMVIRVGEW